MTDPMKPLVPAKSMLEEYRKLDDLWKEAEVFLQNYKAYLYTADDVPTDAFVALLELQHDIESRKKFIIATYRKDELPF